MNDGCCAPAITPTARLCPACGTDGAMVDALTVKALLTETALGRFAAADYRFCAVAACPVVYFAPSGEAFTTADLRVPVWQKQPFGHRMICHCFGENEGDMRREIEQHARSEAVRRVRDHIAAGRCACEVRNPRGVCCLGDVTAAVARVAAASSSSGGTS